MFVRLLLVRRETKTIYPFLKGVFQPTVVAESDQLAHLPFIREHEREGAFPPACSHPVFYVFFLHSCIPSIMLCQQGIPLALVQACDAFDLLVLRVEAVHGLFGPVVC